MSTLSGENDGEIRHAFGWGIVFHKKKLVPSFLFISTYVPGWWSFYSIDARISYAEQKDATQPYIDRFVSSRLPKWLGYLERALKANNNGEG